MEFYQIEIKEEYLNMQKMASYSHTLFEQKVEPVFARDDKISTSSLDDRVSICVLHSSFR